MCWARQKDKEPAARTTGAVAATLSAALPLQSRVCGVWLVNIIDIRFITSALFYDAVGEMMRFSSDGRARKIALCAVRSMRVYRK